MRQHTYLITHNNSTYKSQHILEVAPERCLHSLSLRQHQKIRIQNQHYNQKFHNMQIFIHAHTPKWTLNLHTHKKQTQLVSVFSDNLAHLAKIWTVQYYQVVSHHG